MLIPVPSLSSASRSLFVREGIDAQKSSSLLPLLPLRPLLEGLDTAPDFDTAIAQVLAEICETTNWDYGEIWVLSDDSTVLELSPVWYIASDTADSMSLEQFRLCSEGFVLLPGEGLPGRVWLSRQYERIADATAESESYCLRNQIAKAFDISVGLGVPILANDQVQAVLAFFKAAS
jgi:GAF domain-containing protein